MRRSLWSEIAAIAASAGSVERRAEAVLEPLGRVIPFSAAWIGVRDPETRQHRAVGRSGDVGALARYFALPDADDDLERLGLNRFGPPVRASDLPVPLPEVRAWGEYLLPAGFRDGFALALFSEDGRHLGFISLLTDDPARRTTAYAGLVGALRPLLAAAIDRLPGLAAVAELAGDALGAVAMTRAGSTLPLDGLPGHALLAPRSTVLDVARQLLTATPGGAASFLSPWAGDLVRITVVDCRDSAGDHLAAVVLVRPPPDLRGWSPVHLQVLGALLEGWDTERISARLPGVPVAAVMAELTAGKGPAATEAVVLAAAREGCYVPPALWW